MAKDILERLRADPLGDDLGYPNSGKGKWGILASKLARERQEAADEIEALKHDIEKCIECSSGLANENTALRKAVLECCEAIEASHGAFVLAHVHGYRYSGPVVGTKALRALAKDD